MGAARARQLAAGGITTVRDLLWHLPARYEDRRHVVPISELGAAALDRVTVVGCLRDVRSQRIAGRRAPFSRALVDDGTGTVRAVWFDRPYLARQVAPDVRYLVSGALRPGSRAVELVNPSVEPWTGAPPATLTPVYPRLGPLGPAAVRRLVAAAMEQVDLEGAEPLPRTLLERRGLPVLGDALRGIHLPAADTEPSSLEQRTSTAHRRLAYGELFALQLRLALRAERGRRRRKPQRYEVDRRVRAIAREALPFRLTGAQRQALETIVGEMRSPWPMARLLQGDVGAGKTIVAALAMLVALANGYQVAFMAPTELLAEQHRRSLGRILGARFPVGLLTRSSDERAAVARRIAAGEPLVAVGTHALLEASVGFSRLGLVVIDEQHRFGVLQRQRLAAKGRRPDLLVMTATPIPRSLALVLYGDLDLSVLGELPPGRRPVATRLVETTAREQVLDAIRRHRAQGGQTYVVFPRIAGGGEVPSVEERGHWYLDRLPECRGASLTGRTSAPERERVLGELASGRLDLLVATTVVEVGLDVADASLMVIEGAESFGLSQLHQLRGRVGRGERPSECLAVVGSASVQAAERLQTFASCADGFRIAEADLALRGPGDLLGVRQAGVEAFRVASLLRHSELLEAARSDARELVTALDDCSLVELARGAASILLEEERSRGGRAKCQDAAS